MDEMDYLAVLKGLEELPFPVGKKLLMDFISGNGKNESVQKHRLNKYKQFGSLLYDERELSNLIDNLLVNGLIKYTSIGSNKFLKVIELSDKGRAEIVNPSHFKKKLSYSFKAKGTLISEQDRELFAMFPFLSDLTDEQKKAVLSPNEKILCIAGAGCGKTTVLTRRIDFLIHYRSIDPGKILAITFTRKARREMMNRLAKTGINVHVETFNSFCEKMLRKYAHMVYSGPVRVSTYGDKIRLFRRALTEISMTPEQAVNLYFAEKKDKTLDQLSISLMHDCFSILDFYALKQTPFEDFSDKVEQKFKRPAKMVHNLCKSIKNQMLREGLRDFSDQMADTLRLFSTNPHIIPEFEHILVDEYQDVNSIQVKLLDLLSPKNFFCVGDPRQSIFGWRGSDLRHILDFQDKYPSCEIITLTRNYRSTKHIVQLINESVRSIGLPDLHAVHEGIKETKLLGFESEDAEFEFAIQAILNSPHESAFILARTNKQITNLSQILKSRGIRHSVKSEDSDQYDPADLIVLATIHAIKGLEAKKVVVVGCTPQNFPCRASEHPIIDLVAAQQYDKEEEEKRLFYVAMSRASEKLYITYSGKSSTSFITESMHVMLENKKVEQQRFTKNERKSDKNSDDILLGLKQWRRGISEEQKIPAYLVLHDSTLIEIAARKPITSQELQDIKGLGPAKIRRYGDDILKIVQGF